MDPNVKLVSCTENAEYNIVYAARVCYQSEDETDSRWMPTQVANNIMSGTMTLNAPIFEIKMGPIDERLLRKLMSNDHSATLRFAYAHFKLSDLSIAASRQMVRIAHAGILEMSQRYVSQEGSTCISPVNDAWFNSELARLNKECDAFYNKAIERGFKKEEARYGKLLANTTEMHFSGNFQMFKHLFSLRLNTKTMLETRVICAKMCKLLHEKAPIIFEADAEKVKELGLW